MKHGIYSIVKCMMGAVWLTSALIASGQTPANQMLAPKKNTPSGQFFHNSTDLQTPTPSGMPVQASVAPGSSGPIIPPSQPVTPINGPVSLCPGSLQEYCVPEITGAKYHWSITGEGSITNASDQPCIVVAASNLCDTSFTLRIRVEAPNSDSVFEQTVLVRDVTSPKIVCPKDITVSCDEQLPSVDVSAMVVLENCNGTVVRKFVSGQVYDKTCINRYKLNRVYMVTDACGNTATCSQHLEVNDGVSPNLYCPANITVTCPDPALTPDPSATLAVDNCGGWLAKKHVSDVKTKQITANQFQLTRTYETVDLCGQTGSCTQQIEVFDNKAPGIQCPDALTVSCPGEVPDADPKAALTSDDCDLPVTTRHLGDALSDQICPSRYMLTRTYQVEDMCGHTVTCIQSIRVDDQTPPTITCPANKLVDCADDALQGDMQEVTAGDNCDATVSHVKDEVSGTACASTFLLVRTYKAEDACGGTATCTFRIQLADQSATPVVCPPNVTVSCVSEVPIFNPSAPLVSDHCGNLLGQVTWLGDLIMNKTCNNRFQISRSYRATDGCGYSGVCVQKINVYDTSAPTLVCPADITVNCSAAVPLATSGDVAAQDNCSGGNLTVSVDDVLANQVCPNRYQITRTYRSKDNCGNEGACVQRISVDDSTAPEISCPSNITVACAELVPQADLNLVKSTEDCTGAVTKSFAADLISNQKCANRFQLTRVYEATDLCGNTGSCSQQILVADAKSPSVTCPVSIAVNSTAEVPPAATGSVSASSDNCNGSVTVSHLTDQVKNGACAERYQLIRVYQASDDCGNSATCTQTIDVNDIVAPSGKCPEKITVASASAIPCAGDDPAMNALMEQLQKAYSDNSGTPVLVDVDELLPAQECTPNGYSFGRTIRFRVEDACGNGTYCTVNLSGSCFCTYTQEFWGAPASKIGSMSVTQTLDSLLEMGWVNIGNFVGCGWTGNTAPCILKALPGVGPSTPFRPDSLPTCSSQMKNTLAGQLVALELNIRYNKRFRGLELGKLPLPGSLLLSDSQLLALQLPAPATIQVLQNRANDYLLSFCNDSTYAPGYGDKLSAALAAVNSHWENCQNNTVCPPNAAPDPTLDRNGGELAFTPPADGLWLRPNPASTSLLLGFPASGHTGAQVRVFDADGRLVFNNSRLAVQEGENTLTIDVATWSPGVYWLSLTGENGTTTRRFVVMRR